MINKAKTFHLVTHGCRVNQYESEAINQAWQEAGFLEASLESADIIVLISCAVTARAASSGRKALKQIQLSNPKAELVFTGCAAALPDFKKLEGVKVILSPEHKDLLLQLSQADCDLDKMQSKSIALNALNSLNTLESDKKPTFPAFKLSSRQRSRATLKIQDGCSHHCAYCIVPLTRGASRSREFADILHEAKALLKAGLSELVLSGINLRQFKPSLWQLIDYLEENLADLAKQQKFRIRLSSLDPAQLTTEAFDCIAKSKMLAPHLHLSLQSGSEATLKRMRRGHYQPQDIADFLAQLKTIWANFGLGADLLVGFPAESEAEWRETFAFVESLPLNYAHVFPYSKRPGTLAATYPEQVKREVAKERAAQLRALIAQKKTAFLNELWQKQIKQELVFELDMNRAEGKKGVSQFYAECLWPRSATLGAEPRWQPENLLGKIVDCKILAVQNDVLLVEPDNDLL